MLAREPRGLPELRAQRSTRRDRRDQRGTSCVQVEIQTGRAQMSLQVTSDLVRSIPDIRAHLSTIGPGAQLPVTLFDPVEIAWSELAKSFSS